MLPTFRIDSTANYFLLYLPLRKRTLDTCGELLASQEGVL